jgi:hypothetical protein
MIRLYVFRQRFDYYAVFTRLDVIIPLE